jgi:hypothetical protein
LSRSSVPTVHPQFFSQKVTEALTGKKNHPAGIPKDTYRTTEKFELVMAQRMDSGNTGYIVEYQQTNRWNATENQRRCTVTRTSVVEPEPELFD